MIFELFIAFIILALFFIVVGYYVDIKLLALFGFVTIFLLGLTVNLSGLTYKTGENTTYTYICTICGTPSYNVSECYGTPTPCESIESLGICQLYDYCLWNETSDTCEGIEPQCDTLPANLSCTNAGCNISTATINGTAGINASEIAQTTKTYSYTPLNDNASLWVARWLMIIAVFGFTLVIVQNKPKKE